MPDWDIPDWRRQGRTGPGPFAPKYKSAKNRRAVRKGGDSGCLVWVAGALTSVGAVIGVVADRMT